MKCAMYSEHPERRTEIERALADRGDSVIRLSSLEGFAAQVEAQRPNYCLFDIYSPIEASQALWKQLVGTLDVPVVVFTNVSLERDTEMAVSTGVAAYVVDGFRINRLNAILLTALARHDRMQSLYNRSVQAERRLAERKVIERAKGILMRRRNVPENEAYTAMRNMSMQSNCSLAVIAGRLIHAEELLAQR